MFIEAVIVCVNYSDFLAWTLPLAKPHFDRLIVVTDTKDRLTADLCEHHHVECIKTDIFYANGASFNKGAGINEGLKQLSLAGWVCHMDADIALPPRTREVLERVDLDSLSIHGIDRIMCKSFDSWIRYIIKPEVQHSCDIFIQANAFPLGVRVAKLKQSGYVPIGFFQLWNPMRTKNTIYREHTAADRGDMAFALQWDRLHRVLIPEIVGIHLESPMIDGKMGSNWSGRKTPTFGPGVHFSIPKLKINFWRQPRKWIVNRIWHWFSS